MKVLVITARGLQLSTVGCYGNLWIDTPVLDTLAAQGVVFDAHFADCADAAGLRRTWRDGLYRLSGSPAPVGADLIGVLRGKGVTTCLVLDESRPTPADFSAGWDAVERGTGIDAVVEAARTALARLAEREDWLLWVDLAALLPPWDVPEEFLAPYFTEEEEEDEEEEDAEEEEDEEEEETPEEDEDEEEEEPLTPVTDPVEGRIDPEDDELYFRLQTTYAAAVTHLDSRIGDLLEALGDMDPENEPLVVFTTDCGLALGEHGHVGMNPPRLHEETVHLPLILRLPHADEAGRRVHAPTQAVDLAPTLADVFGAELASAHGHNLLPLVYGEAESIREYACSGSPAGEEVKGTLRTPEWAYLLPGPHLYVKPDDRWEVNDVAQHNLERAEALERTLRAFLEATRQPGSFQAPPLPDLEASANSDEEPG